MTSGDLSDQRIAIIGAGASGLMAADVLSDYQAKVHIYERMPSAGRKILMAGKTGLNISNTSPAEMFVQAYSPSAWLAPFVMRFDANWLVAWFDELGIATYVGSTGRIFPTAMKAAPFLRAWLKRLQAQGVSLHYRHCLVAMEGNQLTFRHNNEDVCMHFDAIILACGGASYGRLGSDGTWAALFDDVCLTPFTASNVGVVRKWSPFMQAYFGQPLKRVRAAAGDTSVMGDVILTHYGLEGGVIYQLNRALRARAAADMVLSLDLLPEMTLDVIIKKLSKNKKNTLSNRLRKLGLDAVKIALLFECVDKADWQDLHKFARHIKALAIHLSGFRPIDEAISTAGGLRRDMLNEHLQLKHAPHVFCAGEMLDWDAPTGGYLLTACFALGRVAGLGVVDYLHLAKNDEKVTFLE